MKKNKQTENTNKQKKPHKQTEITFEKLFFLLKNSLSIVFLFEQYNRYNR